MRYLILVCFTAFLASCASLHNGNYAQTIDANSANKAANSIGTKAPLKSGLIISGEENTELASDYFTALDLTFENTTNDWIRIKSVKIDFGDETLNKEINFPVGQDLAQWANSAQQRSEIKSYNTSLVLGAITAGAGTVGTLSSDKTARNVSLATMGAGGLALTATSLSKTSHSLGEAALVPKTHLLAGAFTIPPGLHVRKWITLYTRNPLKIPYASNVTLTLNEADGTNEKVLLHFRKFNLASSDWQRKHSFVKAEYEKATTLANP